MKMSEIDTENDKKPEIFQFPKILYNSFPNFWRTWWIGTLKGINKEEKCCPVGFLEEFIASFLVKMSQTDQN